MSAPFIIIGSGGHARVVADLLRSIDAGIEGCVSLEQPKTPGDVPWIGTDDAIAARKTGSIRLANGIGSIGDAAKRVDAFARFTRLGFAFPPLVHAKAIVSPHAQLLNGVQVMMGACIQVGARLGENVLINTGATIDHDCEIGAHVSVAPGATVCGNVTVGAEAHIGPGAVILQGVNIGQRAIVAAGAVVRHDVPAGTRVQGVPARKFQA